MLKKINIVTAMMVFAAGMAFAAPADVPKTGQTTISATGDDGDKKAGIAWPGARFTDNSNGTVIDNLTGLIWLKDANCFGVKIWADALTAANGLANSQCGLTDGSTAGDWRLPNVNELESLFHAEYTKATCSGSPCGTNAAWLNTQGFSDTVPASIYWSSTTYAALTSYAWNVNMLDGYVDYGVSKSSYHYVWPVRSGQ